MPRYDYRCQTCRVVFEAQHPMDAPAPACPNGHSTVQRLITRAPALMRGMAAPTSKNASKEELRRKWAEETPKLRKQLADKLGESAVREVPSLNMPPKE